MNINAALKKMVSRRDAYLYHASAIRLLKKPRLIARLVRLYATYLLTKRSPLRMLDMAITARCQYSCPHCYPEEFYTRDKSPLSVAELGALMRQARELDVVQFNFQGGEPTLDLERLECIVAVAEPSMSYISLSSNGFRNKLQDLKRIRAMGVDKIAYSLHSGFPAEHDAFVGWEGAYGKVIDCLKYAPEAGLEVTLALVVSRDTVRSEGIRNVMDLCIDKDIILDVNIGTPVGRWNGAEDVLLRDEDFAWLDEMNSKYPNIRRDLHPHLFRKGCMAAKELLYVNVYGDVLSCPFLHFSLGNVRTHDLGEMRQKAMANSWFAAHHRTCLAAEDKEFFGRYMTRIFNAEKTPIPWESVFGDKRG